MSSVVVDAIELAYAGVAHKARAALSGLSGRRHGRWCSVDVGVRRVCATIAFVTQPFVIENDRNDSCNSRPY